MKNEHIVIAAMFQGRMSNETSIGRRLQTLRLEKGEKQGRALPQAEVSEAVGIARSTLAAYEKGHYLPGRDTLAALANFYDVSIDFLSGQPVVSPSHTTKLGQTPEEAEWVGLWRDMNDTQRRRALAVLRAVMDADAA